MGSPPHLPAEMVEEILLFLPAKSLRRFYSVCKAWKSMISSAGFVRRHRGRAALPGRERVVLELVEFDGSRFPGYERIFLNTESRNNLVLVDDVPISCSSSTSSPEVVVCPFESGRVAVMASCDELWLATDADGCLFLWNPSTRSYKNIVIPNYRNIPNYYKYGVGYDSVGDDYKILKFSSVLDIAETAELYSLRSNKAWRAIPVPVYLHLPFPSGPIVCVSGNLHMISYTDYTAGASSGVYDLICFNLSSDKFGKVALPSYYNEPCEMEVLSVLRGVLCLGLNYDEPSDDKFVMWVMEEYGVATSWTKKFCIKYNYAGRLALCNFAATSHLPLYFGENGELLSLDSTDMTIVYNAVHKDDESRPQGVFFSSHRNDGYIRNVFMYVESLASLEDYKV